MTLMEEKNTNKKTIVGKIDSLGAHAFVASDRIGTNLSSVATNSAFYSTPPVGADSRVRNPTSEGDYY